jgi:CBS domain-containing protein
MPFVAKDLLEGRDHPVTIRVADTVATALKLMIENDYSQLPVVNELQQPLGLVTADLILRGLRNFRTTTDSLVVRDVFLPLDGQRDVYHPEDDVFDMLTDLNKLAAVLIVDNDGRLTGIVTSYDTTAYFRRRAEDLMLVEDIEKALRDHIEAAFTGDTGNLDDDALQEAISEVNNEPIYKNYKAFLKKYINLAKVSVGTDDDTIRQACADHMDYSKSLDELNLNQFKQILLSRWEDYGKHFRVSSSNLANLLDQVREIRNIVAHFRGEISQEQRQLSVSVPTGLR